MKRLSGINPLAYLGVDPTNPPQIFVVNRDPTPNDKKNYFIGDWWVTKGLDRIWVLTGLERGIADWVLVYPGSGGAELFLTDDGNMASPNASDEINILGTTNINTSGASNAVTINLDDNLSIASSLTIDTLTSGVVQTDSNGLFFASNGTDGQVLIGGGTEPNWANITGSDITVTNGPNSIDLTSANVIDADFVTGSGTASPVMCILTIAGGSNINTSASGNTVTVNLDENVSITGDLTVTNDVTVNGNLTVAGDIDLDGLSFGVVQIDGSGVVFADEGTDGQILIGSSSGAPAWANITSMDASVTITNGANSINLEDATGGGIPLGSEGFAAVQPSDYTVTGNVTYFLGSGVALSEIFDDGSNFDPGDGAGTSAKYTAPSDGYYMFFFYNSSRNWNIFSSAGVYLERYSSPFFMITSQQNFGFFQTNYTPNTASHRQTYTVSRPLVGQVYLDMGDTVELAMATTANNPSIPPLPILEGQSSSSPITWVCGWKITS